MKVLFLAAWYPDRYDAMSGLFVRKHAEAVSRFCDVSVLYFVADSNVSDFEVVEQSTNGVVEVYVYYPYLKGAFRRPSKLLNYIRAFVKGYRYLFDHWGKPDVCQANVMTRCAVLAYFLKFLYGIPYVIVEHWSRYLPQDFHFTGVPRKWATKFVVRRAGYVLAVSQVLKEAMLSLGLSNPKFGVVNNVVDDRYYADLTSNPKGKIKILHVSCFDEPSKNLKGILDAVSLLSKQTTNFELNVIGHGPDYDMIVDYSETLQLRDRFVFFKGLQPPDVVAQEMMKSDFFVLFSNFETASVVVCEALAAGLPIVASEICQIPKMIRQGVDMLVPARDVKALSMAMLEMMQCCRCIDRSAIREAGIKYSYPAVGRYLFDIYNEVLSVGTQKKFDTTA